MNSVKKRPRDSYDQTDLQSHTTRLNDRIVKHQLHNYGSAIDVFDAVARTLLPYWEYNERYKIRIFKQLRLDTPSIANMAHHVRAQLQASHNEEKLSTIKINSIDISNGAASVYLESCPHGRSIQILANILGIEIHLVTSYIYEELISIIPNDLLEIQALYIAFNDVSKQFYMLDKPANVKRDDLLQHQQTLDHLIQKYSLLPTVISTPNPHFLSLFLSIAQIFKSNSHDFLDTTGLAIQIRDATYQQITSSFDQYEKYIRSTSCKKPVHLDIRRDIQWLMDSNYYRYQLERPILFALAHVLQCSLVIFQSSSLEEQPEMINIDNNRANRNDQVIVLLKNESTQKFTSARTTYPLNHLFIRKESENHADPVYETIDHTALSDTKNKVPGTNTFFSKTKDKFVTAVNKLVDNYGSIPKKQTYVNNSQQRLNNNTNENSISTTPNDQKVPSIKRQAPLAEHVLRQQDESLSNNHETSEVTYENTRHSLTTPIPRRSSTSSAIPTSAKNSQPSSSNKRQLRPVPYKDRQKTLTRMGTTKTSVNQNIFNGVTVEDVEENTTADEGNNNNDEDDYDSFSDEANDNLQTVILKERKKKIPIPVTSNKFVRDRQTPKSTSYHFDHDALKRQQQSNTPPAEDIYENDRQRDDLNREDDIYLSTSDIIQQDRKQLQLFVNDQINNKQHQQQERKMSTSKLLSTPSNTDRHSFLIDKDAVLEVLGHNIAQRDRHILMKVLKQEDLISKEWQRLLYLLDEYVNNPKKEKKERGLHALTLMENLDRLGYDMLEIQSTGPNHFKAVAKSVLLIIEINDWFSEHICRALHLNGPTDARMIRHLRKLCLREWAKYPEEYRALFTQRNSTQQQRATLDLTREMERFRAEDYYRSDMCALVNQALATALAIPIHIVRAVREPSSPLEIYVPMRGIARPGLAIVLIASNPNAGDGHYDVAVLKGHPQTLRKHRNVTFDDKPEVRSFETNAEEQQHPMLKVLPPNIQQQQQQQLQQQQQQTPMINPALMAAHQAQFFANPFMYSPFAFANPQQQQQAPNSPSLVRATNTNLNNNNQSKTNLTGPTNPTVPQATMMIQPQMPFIQMQQAQPTFVYTPLMHTAQQQPTTNGTATFFYTPANYPM